MNDIETRLLAVSKAVGGPLFGLDTSGRTASLCLVGWGGDAVRELLLPAAMQPSESVAAAIADNLRAAGMQAGALRGIVIGIGPGSFTGLRVGLAIAKGLAMGAGVPLYGVSSLAMLAAAHGPGRVALALDARRGDAFTAVYDVENALARPEIEDAARTPDSFAALLRAHPPRCLVGDVDLEGLDIPRVREPEPRAALAIVQAEERLRAGRSDEAATLVPRYLRVSEAERQAGR